MEEENKKSLVQKIIEKKLIIFTGTFSTITLIALILILSGRQDCELVSIRDGVKKSCDCKGMLVTVKSTASSGERKTVCIGIITDKMQYK